MIPILGSVWRDYIMEAIQSIMDWAILKAQELLGFDILAWDILAPLGFARDSILFLDNLFPMLTCFNILLAGFTVKIGIRVARHLIGWIPTVEG